MSHGNFGRYAFKASTENGTGFGVHPDLILFFFPVIYFLTVVRGGVHMPQPGCRFQETT